MIFFPTETERSLTISARDIPVVAREGFPECSVQSFSSWRWPWRPSGPSRNTWHTWPGRESADPSVSTFLVAKATLEIADLGHWVFQSVCPSHFSISSMKSQWLWWSQTNLVIPCFFFYSSNKFRTKKTWPRRSGADRAADPSAPLHHSQQAEQTRSQDKTLLRFFK